MPLPALKTGCSTCGAYIAAVLFLCTKVIFI